MQFLKDTNLHEQLKYFEFNITSPLSIIAIIIDITIVSYMVYKAIVLVKETRAWSLLKGLLLILALAIISKLLNLRTISYLIDNVFTFAVLSIVVIFQPELRKALEKLGTSALSKFISNSSEENKLLITSMIEEIVKACEEMSSQYVGALIVVERETKVGEYINTGTKIDSETTRELIQNIFVPNTPLHDGAIIIRDMRIMAASCFLPLTDNPNLSKELGTRHRAALGITEISDCIAIVVSEESGKISYALNGGLVRNLNTDSLRKALIINLIKDEKEQKKKRTSVIKEKISAKKN